MFDQVRREATPRPNFSFRFSVFSSRVVPNDRRRSSLFVSRASRRGRSQRFQEHLQRRYAVSRRQTDSMLRRISQHQRRNGKLFGQDFLRLHHGLVHRLEYLLRDAQLSFTKIRARSSRTSSAEQNARTGSTCLLCLLITHPPHLGL